MSAVQANIGLSANQPMDGTTLTLLFTNPQSSLNRDSLYWYYPHNNQSAIRKGDWKLIERLDFGAIELYNLSTDLSEQINQEYQNPEKVMELLLGLRKWRANIPRLQDSNSDRNIDIEELVLLSENWLL